MPFLTTTKFYTPELLRSYPDHLFVFGDNARRTGKGGQAVIRDEPNAIGVATKFAPNNGQAAFFRDNETSFAVLLHDLRVIMMLASAWPVVLPVSPVHDDWVLNIGTGLSAMPNHCPALFDALQRWFRQREIEGEI